MTYLYFVTRVKAIDNVFFFSFRFFLQTNMPNNKVSSESDTENNEPRKWYHRRWVKTICICFVILTIIAIIFSLLLKLNVLTPKKSKTTITTTSSTQTTVISTTSIPTAPSTTIPQPSKFSNHLH